MKIEKKKRRIQPVNHKATNRESFSYLVLNGTKFSFKRKENITKTQKKKNFKQRQRRKSIPYQYVYKHFHFYMVIVRKKYHWEDTFLLPIRTKCVFFLLFLFFSFMLYAFEIIALSDLMILFMEVWNKKKYRFFCSVSLLNRSVYDRVSLSRHSLCRKCDVVDE